MASESGKVALHLSAGENYILDLVHLFSDAPSTLDATSPTKKVVKSRTRRNGVSPVKAPTPEKESTTPSPEAIVTQSLVEDAQLPSELIQNKNRSLWVIPKVGELVGQEIKLPILMNELGFEDEDTLRISTRGFRYKKHGFVLVHLPTDSSEINLGEVFLVRDDGVFVLFGHTAPNIEGITIQDGIFKLEGIDRKLDLDRFEAESWRPSSAPSSPLKTDKGDPIPWMDSLREFAEIVSEDSGILNSDFQTQDHETRDAVRQTFAQNDVRSSVILGPGGSGKTEMLYILSREILQGKFPEIPRTAMILSLSPSGFGATNGNIGASERRIKTLLEICRTRGFVIVLIDEIHAIQGQGAHSENSNDFFQMVKTALSSGQMAIWGSSTKPEFDEAFAGDPPLYQRFEQIRAAPKTQEEVIQILLSKARRFTRLVPSNEVLELIYHLSEYFNGTDAQPRKANQLLQAVYARARMEDRQHQPITVEHVKNAAQIKYKTDLALFDPQKRREKILGLLPALDQNLLGQEELKFTLEDLVIQAYTGTQDPRLPKGRLLMSGPPSHGKTTTPELLAKHLGVPYHRIQMSRFGSILDKDKILALLAKAIRDNTHSVILFDDFEKAPEDLQNVLLETLDSGKFWVNEKAGGGAQERSSWVEVDARHAFLVFATNAAEKIRESKNSMGFSSTSAAVKSNASKTEPLDPVAYEKALIQGGISKAALSRIPHRVALQTLSRDFFHKIMKIEAEKIRLEQEKHQSRSVQWLDLDSLIDQILDNDSSEDLKKKDPRVLLEGFRNRLRQVLGRAVILEDSTTAPLCVSVLKKPDHRLNPSPSRTP